MATRRNIYILSIICALLLLSWEMIYVIWTFFRETVAFFWTESIVWATFLQYIKTILTVLMLAYLFVWFWGKFQSPLISITQVLWDIAETTKESITKMDRWVLYASLWVVYLTILFFTKFLVYFSNSVEATLSVYHLILQLVSIAIFFGLSFISLAIVRNVSMDFLRSNSGFFKITTFSLLYMCFIGLSLNVFSFIVNFLEKIINNTILLK